MIIHLDLYCGYIIIAILFYDLRWIVLEWEPTLQIPILAISHHSDELWRPFGWVVKCLKIIILQLQTVWHRSGEMKTGITEKHQTKISSIWIVVRFLITNIAQCTITCTFPGKNTLFLVPLQCLVCNRCLRKGITCTHWKQM